MRIKNILKISFFTNIFLAILKTVAGYLGNSTALISDGIHSLSDLITDVAAIFGNGMSLKPADDQHPYGHGKSEYVTSFIIGVIILLIGFTLIGNIGHQEITIPSLLVVVVSFVAIILKYFLANFLIRKGKELDNIVLISSGKESSADVVSSVFVLLSSICMQFTSSLPFLKYSDKIAAIIVGLFIIKTGYEILRDSISMILGEIEQNQTIISELKEIICQHPEIKNIDELIVLKYGPYYKITAEISMDPNLTLLEAHAIAHDVEKRIQLNNNKAKYITIHVNPVEKDR